MVVESRHEEQDNGNEKLKEEKEKNKQGKYTLSLAMLTTLK